MQGPAGFSPYYDSLTASMNQGMMGVYGQDDQLDQLEGMFQTTGTRMGTPVNDMFESQEMQLAQLEMGRGMPIGPIPNPNQYYSDMSRFPGLDRYDDGAHGWPAGTVTTNGGYHVEYGKNGNIEIFGPDAEPGDKPMYTLKYESGGGGDKPDHVKPSGGGDKPDHVKPSGGGDKPDHLTPSGGGDKPEHIRGEEAAVAGEDKPDHIVPDKGEGHWVVTGPDGKPININPNNSDFVLPDGTIMAFGTKDGKFNDVNMVNGNDRMDIRRNADGSFSIGRDYQDGWQWMSHHVNSGNFWSRPTYQVQLSPSGRPQLYEFVGDRPEGVVKRDGRTDPRGPNYMVDPRMRPQPGSYDYQRMLMEQLMRMWQDPYMNRYPPMPPYGQSMIEEQLAQLEGGGRMPRPGMGGQIPNYPMQYFGGLGQGGMNQMQLAMMLQRLSGLGAGGMNELQAQMMREMMRGRR